MTCGHCVGAGKIFGDRRARRELARYRRKGPAKTTTQLVEAIAAQGLEGSRVLDIGAGVGAVHLSLLAMGATEAFHVDASPAYQRVSEDEARRRALQDQVQYLEGDYLDVADQVPDVDIVCLARVICCYPDMVSLVKRSAGAAGSCYGVVFPVDRAWVRALIGMANLGLRLLRNPFRTFVHSEVKLKETVEAAGLSVVYEARSGMWKTLVFRRAPMSQSRPSSRSSV